MGQRRTEQGFTLVELMVVVAVIGVLAKLALPSFFRESSRGTAKSEVVGVFAELTNKELNYESKKGVYLAAAACPASSTGKPQDVTACSASGGVWASLGTLMPTATVYCSYQITAGTSAQTAAPPAGFTMRQPATGWFFIVATCLVGGTTYTFFTCSDDSTMQIK